MKLPRQEHAKAVNSNGSFRRVISDQAMDFILITELAASAA
jgi:hypothetical protein